MNILPMDKVTHVSKPQADAINSMADSVVKANNSKAILIGVAGAIAVLHAIIVLIQNHDNNKHEERMMELELEKLKIKTENKEEVLS